MNTNRNHLTKPMAIVFSVTLSLAQVCISNDKDIYKWTDDNGNVHYTDNPSQIPKEENIDIIVKGKSIETDYESQLQPLVTPSTVEEELLEDNSIVDEEEPEREYWGGRALELNMKEQEIIDFINITKREIAYKKREVEFFLTNGYAADQSIMQLRYLEDRLKDLEFNLSLIEPEREKLREEARRAGVPPGYLRP